MSGSGLSRIGKLEMRGHVGLLVLATAMTEKFDGPAA